MTTVRLRHLAQVNPLTPAFDRLADEDELTFLPMEAVWPGSRLDVARRRTKVSVATGYTRFQDGDVLVPKITPTFEASRSVLIGGLFGGVGAGTTELHVVRPGPHIDPRFLLYVVNTHSFLKLGEAEMHGVAGQQRVPDSFLRDFLVELPPLEEQRRIADFLDAETARIDQLALKRRQMRSLLTLKRERVIESTLGLERAQTTDGLVPLKHLVADVTVGIVITPAKWYVEVGGTPALRGLNVKPGFINTGDLVQISAEGHAVNRKSQLNAGDVVVVRTGQAGAAAVVPAELDGANCIDLIVVRPGSKLSPRYLQYVLNSDYASARVTEHSVGSIQAHFNVGAMKQIPIPSIPRSEQDEIVRLLDTRVGALDLLHRKLDSQEQLLTKRRQALITAAVTGQFDVSTANGRNVTDGVPTS
ncbi:restriction endonuclease subunit S [Streptomyces sp. NPDC014623]|uniref:restriction endonuclease subunit S n=1 Tax=Streptomyces sp. NPDC014623 TaxID=3364875 RepID=UPI0036F86D35